MPNSTYATALSVTTFDEFSPNMWNLILGQNKITRTLDRMGFVKRETGGANLTERLQYAENGTFGSISEYESVDLTPQEPFTAAQFAWKIIAGAFSLSNLAIFKNTGSKHQISNLMTELLTAAARTGVVELSRQIWATGLLNGGKDFGGFAHLVTTDGTGTVGGIVAGTDTWWKNQFSSSAGSFAANGIDLMATVSRSCERNGHRPFLFVGDQDFVEGYERSALQIKRIVQENTKAHDLGLNELEYRGGVVMNDPNVTAGYLYMLTPETIKLRLGTDMNFKKSPMVSPVDQDVKTQLFVLYGNMTVSDRATQGLISGLTYP